MCKEDYVSFEIAKLLKEKGFDEECISYYVDYEPNDVKYSLLGETNSTWESRCCSAPTLQMAMKWLREVHNIIIDIAPNLDGDRNIYPGFCGIIFENGSLAIGLSAEEYTYEQACELAIKYSLKNLI